METKAKTLILFFLIVLSLSVFVASIQLIEPRESGVVSLTKNLNVTITDTGMIINNIEIEFFINQNGQRKNFTALPPQAREQINFQTNLKIEDKSIIYNHTFPIALIAQISKVGYIFPQGICDFNSTTNILDCENFIINFSEAKTKQGFDMGFDENKSEFTFTDNKGDLSFIDPIIQATGAPESSLIARKSFTSLEYKTNKLPEEFLTMTSLPDRCDKSGAPVA